METSQVLAGKTDTHIGLYHKEKENFEDAKENITKKMLRLLSSIKRSTRILILGSGYGDTARHIATQYKCKVDCLNPDKAQNEHNENAAKEAELEKHINIIQGGLDKIPFDREHYDYIWSQGELLHHEDAGSLFRSVHYVLKPEGRFVFTVPVIKAGAELPPSLSEDSGMYFRSMDEYLRMAKKADLGKIIATNKSKSLLRHFQELKTLAETSEAAAGSKKERQEWDSIINQYGDWIEAAANEQIGWGIFLFQKRNA